MEFGQEYTPEPLICPLCFGQTGRALCSDGIVPFVGLNVASQPEGRRRIPNMPNPKRDTEKSEITGRYRIEPVQSCLMFVPKFRCEQDGMIGPQTGHIVNQLAQMVMTRTVEHVLDDDALPASSSRKTKSAM